VLRTVAVVDGQAQAVVVIVASAITIVRFICFPYWTLLPALSVDG
jgi:hypothetical protein